MSARKALGRGLDALIPEKPAEKKPAEAGAKKPDAGLQTLPISEIKPGRFQPRMEFDEAALKELSESIKTQGVLQPLLVRSRKGGGYELIAGERRWRAAKMAGLASVPVVVHEADDRTALELSIIENIQREDLGPLEEAEAYKRLLAEFEYTQEQLSGRIGKDRATIANLLRLLNLPEDIKEDLREGRITAGHARAMLAAGAESVMRSIRDAVVKDGISVREAERRAQGVRKPGKAAKKARPVSSDSVHLRDMEEKLLRALGTKVKIELSGKGGKIEIRFFSADELDRIYRRIVG